MLPDPDRQKLARDWLRFARSDLQLASLEPHDDVLPETLAFHAQQAVEKGFKAVLTALDVDFPPTHNLNVLRELMPDCIDVPDVVASAAGLSIYAVSSRYPQDEGAMDLAELAEAVKRACAVMRWVESILS